MLWALSLIFLAGVAVYYFSDYRKYSKRHDLHEREMAASNKVDDELKRCYEEIETLEKRAGIYDEVEDAALGPLLPTVPDAHYGSERWRREHREIEQGERDYLHHRADSGAVPSRQRARRGRRPDCGTPPI